MPVTLADARRLSTQGIFPYVTDVVEKFISCFNIFKKKHPKKEISKHRVMAKEVTSDSNGLTNVSTDFFFSWFTANARNLTEF